MYCWMFERDWVSCYLIGFLSVYEFWHVLDAGDEENANEIRTKNEKGNMGAGVNQHLWPVHHPLDACPNSVVDELQLSYKIWFHIGNPFGKKQGWYPPG